MSGKTKGGPPRGPRRKDGEGCDPLMAGRVPVAVIEAVKAVAAARNVPYSRVIREALARYVGQDRAA